MSDRRGSRGWFGFGREGAGAKTVSVGPAASGTSGTSEAKAATSPVTDAARTAALGLALPDMIPPGAAAELTIDALGRKCPIPIIMLANQIRDVPVGSVIAVLADDPAAYSDIPAWCGMKSHVCVYRAVHETGWAFGVRRSY